MALQPAGTHLAQLNVGRIRYPSDDQRMGEFMGALDRINALAERSPGFVWRLKSDSGNATDIKVTSDPMFLINMSVWKTAEAFEHFVWQTVHKRFYQRMRSPHFVMWWIAGNHIPTPEEALARLAHLTKQGPSDSAFGWESLPSLQPSMRQRCA